jgi:hypothetical protein
MDGRWMVVRVWLWLQRLSSLSRDSGRSIRIDFFPFSDSFVLSSRRRLNPNTLFSHSLYFGDAGCVDHYASLSANSMDCLLSQQSIGRVYFGSLHYTVDSLSVDIISTILSLSILSLSRLYFLYPRSRL